MEMIQKEKSIVHSLPQYSKKEELWNVLTHVFGALFGIIALILGIIKSIHLNSWVQVLGMSIYGLSLILLYVMSSLYHFLKRGKAKAVFRVLDHCSIFILIAGTYTPICLGPLNKNRFIGTVILIILWVLAILGITLNAVMMNKVKIISMVIYLMMGWCALIVIRPVIHELTWKGFTWILLGGILYTIGAILYMFSKKNHMIYGHCIWHLFVLLGSFVQYIGIYLYVL